METFIAEPILPSFCIMGTALSIDDIKQFLANKGIVVGDPENILFEMDMVLYKQLAKEYQYYIDWFRKIVFVGIRVEDLPEHLSIQMLKQKITDSLYEQGFTTVTKITWIYKGVP